MQTTSPSRFFRNCLCCSYYARRNLYASIIKKHFCANSLGNSSVYLYLGEVSERVVDVAHGRSDMIRVPASTYMPWCALSICT